MPNGATRGHVVGCLDSKGLVQDLDQLRLQVEQKIRDAVIPPPQVTIFEEKVASSTPILVVEVRPTDPPHRVGDRYQVRGAAGLQALTQHDALLLFRNQRTQAWIDELGDSNPLLAVLRSLQRSYEDLAFRLSDTALLDEGVRLDEIEQLLSGIDRSQGALHENMDAVRSDLELLSDPISAIDDRTDALGDAYHSSPERIWHQLRERREMRWFTVNQHAAWGEYSKEDLALIELMIREHFGSEPNVLEYPANLAELQGYNVTFSADKEPQPHLEVVASFINAAISRAQGVPLPFSADWISEGVSSRKDPISMSSDLSLDPKHRRPPAKPVEREMGILNVSADGAQALADHARATTAPEGQAIIWRTDQGAIMAARSTGGRSVPVMYRPTWGLDFARRGKPRTGSLGAEFRKVLEAFDGQLLRIDGPGSVLGGRAPK